ncbi:MAG: flavodoxin reductase [Thiogranum sp.]|nr:flavodoxin reductase [Thiogranum sp.]
MQHTATLLLSEFVTHDVKRFIVSMPDGFAFQPGQGVELAINRAQWKTQGRPFTPTSLPDDRVLEFTIKGYPEHAGMTRELHTLAAGTELLVSEPFGTITYKGPGMFIAAGAGVTPFISILRDLARSNALADHALVFSNKTPADVICEKELRHYLGDRCILTCTRSAAPGCDKGRIDEAFLAERIKNLDQRFYVCGPPAFVDSINAALRSLGANPEALVFEQ